MGDLSTYSLVDFIPFVNVVYQRLFVRVNEALWPAQIVAGLVACLAVWAAVRGWQRIMGWLLAGAWVSVGWFFHMRYYAELNWAATYVGWAFFLQALVLVLVVHYGEFEMEPNRELDFSAWLGLVLAAVGLVIYPLVPPLFDERSWRGVEIFGCMPNPTVIVTMALATVGRRAPWPVFAIPILWCLVTAATAYAIGTIGGLVAAGLGALALVLAVWRGVFSVLGAVFGR